MAHQHHMNKTIGTDDFTTFLQTNDVTNFYWLSFGPITNIIFLLKGGLI